MGESVRAFVAFDLDDASIASFAALGERLRAAIPRGVRASFVAPEKMHVTAKFLGPTDLDRAPAFDAMIRALADRPAPLLRASAIDAFGSARRAHVIVVPLADADGALAAIAGEVDARAEALGFAKEARAYRPHVTLARLRETTDVRRWIAGVDVAPGAVRATHLALYRSDGGVYTPLARAPFAG